MNYDRRTNVNVMYNTNPQRSGGMFLSSRHYTYVFSIVDGVGVGWGGVGVMMSPGVGIHRVPAVMSLSLLISL